MREMTLRIPRSRLAFWALASIAWLVSHDAVFLAQLGPGAGLARTLRNAAHGYWEPLGVILLAIGIGVAVLVVRRVDRLSREARRLGATATPRPRVHYVRRVARSWGPLFACVAIAFLVQENAEHLGSHGHLIGTGALVGPEYPLALPVIGSVTLVAALFAVAVGGVERSLVEAIAWVVARPGARAPSRVRRPAAELRVLVAAPLAGTAAGRAPPPDLIPALT